MVRRQGLLVRCKGRYNRRRRTGHDDSFGAGRRGPANPKSGNALLPASWRWPYHSGGARVCFPLKDGKREAGGSCRQPDNGCDNQACSQFK